MMLIYTKLHGTLLLKIISSEPHIPKAEQLTKEILS